MRSNEFYIPVQLTTQATSDPSKSVMAVFPFPHYDVIIWSYIDPVEGVFKGSDVTIVEDNGASQQFLSHGGPNAVEATTANVLAAMKWCEEQEAKRKAGPVSSSEFIKANIVPQETDNEFLQRVRVVKKNSVQSVVLGMIEGDVENGFRDMFVLVMSGKTVLIGSEQDCLNKAHYYGADI